MRLNQAESDELRRNIHQIFENKVWLDYQLAAFREAHLRDGVEVVPVKNDDGTKSYRLQVKPKPTTETVN